MLYKGTSGQPTLAPTGGENIPLHVAISYYLTIKDGGKVVDAICLPNEPEEVLYEFLNDHDVIYTVSGEKIHRRAVDRRVSIRISGRSGYADKYYWRLSKGAELQDPQEVFVSFNDFLYKDHSLNTGLGNQRIRESAAPESTKTLTFTDLLAGLRFYDCVPVAFSYKRAVGDSRFGYIWQLELIAYSEADSFVSTNIISAFLKSTENAVNNVTSVLDTATAVIQGTRSYISLPIQSALGTVNRMMASTRRLTETTREAVSSIRSTLTAVRAEIHNVFHSVMASVETIKSIADDELFSALYWEEVWGDWSDGRALLSVLTNGEFPPARDPAGEPVLEELVSALEQLEYDTSRTLGYLGQLQRLNTPPINSGGSFLDKIDAFRLLATEDAPSARRAAPEIQYTVYILKAGENLYDVAIAVYGDVAQWATIAEANGWLDAHTTATGALPVAGQRILIPINSGTGLLSISPRLATDQSPFLTDILMVNGDLQLSRSYKDIQLVKGEDNFKQAMTHRLITQRGELPLDPAYGLTDQLGTQNTITRPDQVSLDVIEQLLADERVLAINDVNLTQRNDYIDLRISIVPVEGAVVSVVVPV